MIYKSFLLLILICGNMGRHLSLSEISPEKRKETVNDILIKLTKESDNDETYFSIYSIGQNSDKPIGQYWGEDVLSAMVQEGKAKRVYHYTRDGSTPLYRAVLESALNEENNGIVLNISGVNYRFDSRGRMLS